VQVEREFFIDNLLVRIHFVIVMIRRTVCRFVALPSSTFDWAMIDGVKEIPIESRAEREVKYIQALPWREAGPPNHHDDRVDSDQ